MTVIEFAQFIQDWRKALSPCTNLSHSLNYCCVLLFMTWQTDRKTDVFSIGLHFQRVSILKRIFWTKHLLIGNSRTTVFYWSVEGTISRNNHSLSINGGFKWLHGLQISLSCILYLSLPCTSSFPLFILKPNRFLLHVEILFT